MKYWDAALNALENSDRSFSAVYRVMFSFGENVFFEWSDGGRIQTMTYHSCQLCAKAAASRIADALSEVPCNAFVGLRLDNCPAWVIAFWGILMAGYRPLLINTRLPDEQNEALLGLAGAAAVVSDRPLGAYRFVDTRDMDRPPLAPVGFSARWADQIALCSSGTSGCPKLCLFDGRSISAQIGSSRYVLRQNDTINTYYKGEAKLLAFLPFYHVFGLVANLLWFSFFGRIFVFPRDLSAESIMEACRRHGVTHLFAIPLLFNTLAAGVRRVADENGQAEKLEKALRLSIRLQSVLPRFGARLVRGALMRGVRMRTLGPSVRFCITGGGFVPADTLYVVNGLGYALYNGFGMTEIGIGSVELRLPARDRLTGSVGRPFPSVEYRVDGDARGELLVRGDTLFSAMLEGGAEIKRDPESWYATGDLACCDSDGNYYVEGRLDDLIVTSGGENLAPDALEARFMLEHVRRLCVVGLPDERSHTIAALVVEPEDNLPPLILSRLIRQIFEINRSLPLGLQLGRVLLAEEPLPIVMESKVQRGELRRRLSRGTLACRELQPEAAGCGVSSQEYNEALAGVTALFAKTLGCRAEDIGPDAHLVRDLGASSLQYFALAARIGEAYRISLDASGGTACATPREFAEYILRGG